ncbi:damage-inducible protein DinB [Paenibacillus hemerocallicola]|jgi:uncharacterized damage-inducible protein DinB|uniref:Damage-inducible protein DinB n=1 Tax=Paenibacillus hemerocallicola TaxID=1172614 RepID=A0A5C4TDN7_9BACL|nr:DinB family protein [Paenibacillus hemerocallicola]TNJ66609.1 damage-inducible protein DinB [Paenibacillus hemerocallicola]
MYTSIASFLKDWAVESALTLAVLERLTDASLKQAVSHAQARTLGDLGWHLTNGTPGIAGAAGLQLDGSHGAGPTPANAAEIVEGYRRMSDALAAGIERQWTDGKLSEGLLLFGFMETTYGGALNTIVRHQIHHRGQMTILMRQAGLVPPGVYGPNEEESAAMRKA